MDIRTLLHPLAAVLLLGCCFSAHAAEIAVAPGTGTLQAAISDTGTMDGDVLVLLGDLTIKVLGIARLR